MFANVGIRISCRIDVCVQAKDMQELLTELLDECLGFAWLLDMNEKKCSCAVDATRTLE